MLKKTYIIKVYKNIILKKNIYVYYFTNCINIHIHLSGTKNDLILSFYFHPMSVKVHLLLRSC